MNILGQRTLGIILLVLLGALVAVKKLATGSLFKDRPSGGLGLWLVHIFNMGFLLVVNPLVAVLLTTGRLAALDPTRPPLDAAWPVLGLEAAGLALCVAGYALMAWALLRMGTGYQVGGCAPRPGDRLLTGGPYRLVRHPLYAAALFISFGLASLAQSLALAAVFCAYVVLLAALIPAEEKVLQRIYGESYDRYRQEVGAVFPRLSPLRAPLRRPAERLEGG
jgi:protein-S-isoprenylcysteine O-methyltransferase Ste14